MNEKKKTIAYIILISLLMIALVIGYLIFGTRSTSDNNDIDNDLENDIDVSSGLDIAEKDMTLEEFLDTNNLEIGTLLETFGIYEQLNTLSGEYTFLAPVNGSFSSLDIVDNTTIENLIVLEPTYSNGLRLDQPLTTLGGKTVTFRLVNGELFVESELNTLRIVSPDNVFMNGIVHTVDGILL